MQDFIWPVYFGILAKYRNLLAAEPYSEPCQMYNMELFGKWLTAASRKLLYSYV